jgi:hypothetical protein
MHYGGVDDPNNRNEYYPAVRDFLRLTGRAPVKWQFVDEQNVPLSPWKTIITKSQVSY